MYQNIWHLGSSLKFKPLVNYFILLHRTMAINQESNVNDPELSLNANCHLFSMASIFVKQIYNVYI